MHKYKQIQKSTNTNEPLTTLCDSDNWVDHRHHRRNYHISRNRTENHRATPQAKKYHRRWRQHRAITVDTVDIVDTVDTVDTVETVDTVDTVETVDTVDTVDTVRHCSTLLT